MMTFISCDFCGVILDKEKLRFPTNIYNEDGSIDINLALFQDRWGWVAKVSCPVCKSSIPELQ